jgi:hypothetical protein
MSKNPIPECGSLEASIQLRSVALAYIQERRKLLAFLKTSTVGEECSEAFDVALACLKDLDVIARDIHIALSHCQLSPLSMPKRG